MNDVVDYMFSHQVLYYVEYLSLQRYKKVRAILKNPMKRQSRLHCDQIEHDETQEPSSVPSAISLGNPSIPCSVSLSGGASDVRMAQPTVQKHRIPCML